MKYILLFLLIVILLVFYGRYSRRTFILYYHKIDEFKRGGLKSLFVRPVYFNLQMRYLYWRGYRTISLEELINILKEKRQIPKKVFVITFDDGYKNNYINAYPILKRYNFKASIFLTADSIGKSAAYPGEPSEEHLNIEEIKQMTDVFAFGSHTLTHPELNKLTDKTAEYEISESKKKLYQTAGVEPKTFCYPFGKYNDSTVEIVKKYYIGACTTKSGLVNKKSDVYRLPRIEFKDILAMSFKDFFKAIEFYIKIFLGV